MPRKLDLIIIFAGFVSVVAQAMLIREFIMVFSGNEFALGIIFSNWLFWVGLGSWGLGRFVERLSDKPAAYVYSIIFIVLLIPLQLVGIKLLRFVFGLSPGEIWSIPQIFISVFLLLAPLCLIVGGQFSLGCRLYAEYEDKTRSISRVYIYDALGDMLGGFLFGYVFAQAFSAWQTAAVLIFLCAMVLVVMIIARPAAPRFAAGMGIIIVILCILSFFLGARQKAINLFSEQWNWPGFKLVDVRQSRYANFVVVEKNSQKSLFTNGNLSLTFGDVYSREEIAHLPLLQLDWPKRVLVISGAVNGVLAELLKYSEATIDYLELDQAVITLSRPYIRPEDSLALFSPRVRLAHIDGRLFLKKYAGEKFDAAIINTGQPQTVETNRFYSREFYQEIKRVLKDNGVIFFGMRSNENYLGEEMREFNGSIYSTLKQVFPYTEVVPGETLYVLASQRPGVLTIDPAKMEERRNKQNIATRYLNRNTLSQRFYPGRMQYIKSVLENGKFRLNRDFYPLSFYYLLMLWEAQFQSRWTRVFADWLAIKYAFFTAGFLVLLLAILLAFSRRQKKYIGLCVFNTGFAVIILELVLIMGLEAVCGYIYHLIGVIVAAFMAGLVVGALCARGWQKNKRALFWLQALLAGYALFLPLIFFILQRAGLGLNLSSLVFVALAITDGIFAGGVFYLANSIYLKEETELGKTAGTLYGLDLAGACAGSLLTTLFFVPAFGLNRCCYLVAAATMLVTAFGWERRHG